MNSGAVDVNDAMKLVNGIDIFQSGTKVKQHQFLLEAQVKSHACPTKWNCY